MGRENDYSKLVSAENSSLTGSSSKHIYVKAEMKLKQGVLLVAALIQLVRNLPTCLSVISAPAFHRTARVFCVRLVLLQEKRKGVAVDIWWAQDQLTDWVFIWIFMARHGTYVCLQCVESEL